MSYETDYVDDFAAKMKSNMLFDAEKQDWKDNKDIWWYFQKIVISVREMDDKLTANPNANIYDDAVDMSALLVIIANIQGNNIDESKIKNKIKLKPKLKITK